MIGTKMIRIALAGMLCFSLLAAAPATVNAHCDDCTPCCCPPPPPPVCVKWCVKDPCDPCCTGEEVSACLPACCADQTPCLDSWKKGLFGRKILTYKFSCGECVDVVLTRRGAKVR